MTKNLHNEAHLDLRLRTSRVQNLSILQSPIITNHKKSAVMKQFMTPSNQHNKDSAVKMLDQIMDS